MKKLRCTKAQRLIVSALDEGLDWQTQEELDRHLAECPGCAEFQEETAEVLRTICRSSGEDPGEAFWTRYHVSLNAQIRAREPWSRGLWTWTNAAFAGGFAMILLVVGIGAMELWYDSPMVNATHLAAIQEIDRLFDMGSDDWFLYEPRLPRLVADYDPNVGSYESSGSSWLNPAHDNVFDADQAWGEFQ